MAALPTGTVTLLFTFIKISISTRLLRQPKDAYADVLAEYHRLVRTAVQERGGQDVHTEGDAVFAAFPSARQALLAAVTAQQTVRRHPWPDGAAVKVQIGLDTQKARVAESGDAGTYIRVAAICRAAHGGQILLSDTVSALVANHLPDGVSLRDLGEHRVKDLIHPPRVFQVVVADLPFPEKPAWKKVLEPSRARRLLVLLAILWGLTGLLAHSESTRAGLEDFTQKRVKPALDAIDPWFLMRSVLDYTGPNCSMMQEAQARLKHSRECDDPGLILRMIRLPSALWRTAGDVRAAGWPAIVSTALSLLVGVSLISASEDTGWPWWHPATMFLILLIAGLFSWLLKLVFLGLFNLFGSLVAFTGVYSTQIIALDILYNAVMTWFHLPHRSSARA